MKTEKVRVKRIAAVGVVFLISFMFATTWIVGFEPQIVKPDSEPIRDTSFQKYIQVVVEHNGDTCWVRALATVAYPGARVGAFVRNKLVLR